MSYRLRFQKHTNKKNKYGAKSQNYGGKWYHSKKEAGYAENLDWLVKSGEVIKWERQVKLDLSVNGVHITNYYIDFKVWKKDGTIEYVEVKGFETPEWQLKWRLLQAIKHEILEPESELIVIK